MFIENTPSTLHFEILLTQFIAVLDPLAKAIQCLEASNTNPADVFLYWIAIVASVKRTLETCHIPDEVCSQIRAIINARWKEFFISGPTNVHLCAFFLNPGTSNLFQNHSTLLSLPSYRLRAFGYLLQSQSTAVQHHPPTQGCSQGTAWHSLPKNLSRGWKVSTLPPYH